MSHPSQHFAIHKLSRRKTTKYVDYLTYLAIIVGNLAVLPQIFVAWNSDAPGLAITTWILFTVVGLVWLSYAVLHKSKQLIIAQSVGIAGNMLVVAGWMIHHPIA